MNCVLMSSPVSYVDQNKPGFKVICRLMRIYCRFKLYEIWGLELISSETDFKEYHCMLLFNTSVYNLQTAWSDK